MTQKTRRAVLYGDWLMTCSTKRSKGAMPVVVRISANVTGDFGNVTEFGRLLGCADLIVGMGSIRAGGEPPSVTWMGA
jgi:hypothetical protein